MFEWIRSLRNKICRRRIIQNNEFNISPHAKVNFCSINTKKNCTLTVEDGSIIEGRLIFERDHAHISIGKNTFIGDSTLVCAEKIIIGNDVLIAWGCNIVDHNSHSLFFRERKEDVINWFNHKKDWTNVIHKPIVVEDKAWIGFNSVILKGVTIREGAIVGAGSIVTKDVPPYTIVAGNPARIIREILIDER